MSEQENITRAAGVVAFFTFLSRVAGFARDLVTAYYFGAGMAADAFFVAFRIPNQLRRLLAEGCLTVAFIPIYTEYLTQRGKEETQEFVSAMLGVLLLVLLAVVAVGVVFSPAFITVTAPGFVADQAKFDLTVILTQIMFPYVMMVSLVAFFMGILNSHGQFGAPAFSSAELNIVQIITVVVLYQYFSRPIVALAVGVLLGGLAQVILQLPFIFRLGISLRPRISFRHPGVRRILHLMLPAVFGVAVYQFNVFFGTLLASLLREGSVSYLYYATRLIEFPLGIFAVALGTAVLPSMARQATAGDIAGLKDSISYALRLVMFINAPAMIGLIVFRQPIVSVLFERGCFDAAASAATADAVLAYAVGLWAVSAARVLVPAYYSLQDTRTPVKCAVVALAANVILSLALMGPAWLDLAAGFFVPPAWLAGLSRLLVRLDMSHAGLALANSIAAALNMFMLIYGLKKKLGSLGLRRITDSILKTTLASIGMAVIIYGLTRLSWGMPGTVCLLALDIGLGVVAYFAFSYLVGNPELPAMLGMVRKVVTRFF
ncbi:MAG: murein biosynthesis integral membrane protein MurJ [Pseudomonadota bacterium]